jgi:hypothetical protein
MGTRDWITTATKSLGLESRLRLVEPHRFLSILERVVTERTTLGKDALSGLWWWEALREPVYSAQVPDPIKALEQLIPGNESVWFIAEASGKKELGNFWLYEGDVSAICAVLRECPAFEYYVVERRMRWLLCENHHGLLIGSGEPMATSLSEA